MPKLPFKDIANPSEKASKTENFSSATNVFPTSVENLQIFDSKA